MTVAIEVQRGDLVFWENGTIDVVTNVANDRVHVHQFLVTGKTLTADFVYDDYVHFMTVYGGHVLQPGDIVEYEKTDDEFVNYVGDGIVRISWWTPSRQRGSADVPVFRFARNLIDDRVNNGNPFRIARFDEIDADDETTANRHDLLH